MFIRPALDKESEIRGARLKVRDPDTFEFLPDEGAEKPESEYWLRRLVLDESVKRVDPPSAEKAEPKPEPEPKKEMPK